MQYQTMWAIFLITLSLGGEKVLSQRDVISTGRDFAENEGRVFWKIIGGEEAKYDEFPYMLSLELNGKQFCGASVIGDYWALTAAHCLSGVEAEKLSVRAGSLKLESGGTVHRAKRLVLHHHFRTEGNYDNDIGLIEVEDALTSNKYVKPVALPSHKDVVLPPGTLLTVSGWGATKPIFEPGIVRDVLKKAIVVVMSKQTCQEDPTLTGHHVITDNMICAQKTNDSAYKGDSGGPLVLRGDGGTTQVGVVSWGDFTAQQKHPTVYTSVSRYRLWIYLKSGI